MRRLLGSALLLLSCTGTDGTRPPEIASLDAPLVGDPARRARIERDLVLVVARTGSGAVEADDPFPVTTTITNRGAIAHWMVRPDSGSGVGWREPHVFYTAEMETAPGAWRSVPLRDDYTRCSRYANDWTRDAVEMTPGASMDLDDLVDPSRALDFPRSGRIRLYAHYAYDGGKKRWFRPFDHPVPLPDDLESGGPFALVSAPLELDVHVDTSLELALVLRRRDVHVRERVTLAALAEAWVVNHSGARLDLGDDFLDHRFQLEVRDGDGARAIYALDGPAQLAPHARAALHAAAFDGDLWSDAPGTMRLRLRLDGVHRFRSPWVDLHSAP